MAPFWKRATCPTKIKLRILNAIVSAQLLYSTSSMWLNQGDCRRLDAFFYQALRQILKYKSTFVDRTRTNHALLTEANRRLNIGSRGTLWRTISPFSVQWNKKREKLLMHVIRSAVTSPMRMCTFDTGTAVPLLPDRRRVGRPRSHWTICGLQQLWDKFAANRPDEVFNPLSLHHSEWITNLAASRPP